MPDSDWSQWGDVPTDGDVVPFGRLQNRRSDKDRNNKRHHYLSVTYMNGFTNPQGKMWTYRSETPENPHPVRPASIGFEKYYYSTETEDGNRENHQFEDIWCAIEDVWPATLQAVRDRRLSHAISFNVLGMAVISKVRVPAARDRNSLLLAAELRASTRAMESLGKLPEEFQLYLGKLDKVPVGINPQRTLAVLSKEMKAFGDLCFRLGFEVLHNATDIPFISSDNPVCFYDPNRPLHARAPYDEGDDVELTFPLDAQTLLRGSTRLRPVNQVVRHRTLRDRSAVRRLNRTTAQFGYRFLIAQDRQADDLARIYAAKAPTVETDVRFEGDGGRDIKIHWRHVFGPRPTIDLFVNSAEKAARVQANMEARGIV